MNKADKAIGLRYYPAWFGEVPEYSNKYKTSICRLVKYFFINIFVKIFTHFLIKKYCKRNKCWGCMFSGFKTEWAGYASYKLKDKYVKSNYYKTTLIFEANRLQKKYQYKIEWFHAYTNIYLVKYMLAKYALEPSKIFKYSKE